MKAGQDYIADWANAWGIDHYFEASRQEWSNSAAALYFDADKKEIIFTELYAEIKEVTSTPN